MLPDAEWIYYGYISYKFLAHEFKIYANWLKMNDSEAYEYLQWLAKRHRWPFVHGDVLQEGIEKWKYFRLHKARARLANMLV